MTEAQATQGQILGISPVATDGEIVRVLLAFLGSAGMFYVNIMPALVSGLIEGLGFTTREAGLVGSANVYGAAFGALMAVMLIKRLPWRATCSLLFLVLICADLVSMLVTSAEVMLATRFVHGFAGGLSVGIAFAVMARTSEPDKTFAYLLVVQFSLGGLGIMVLPPLVPIYGPWVLFASLIGFTLVTLLMVPFIPQLPPKAVPENTEAAGSGAGIRWLPLLLTLAAIFLFQAANMGLFAYMIGLGKHYGLDIEFVSPALGVASWVAVPGSALVIFLSTRFGRLRPLAIGIGLTVVATAVLHWSEMPWVYAITNCVVGVTWAFVLPYLFGMCSEFDQAGQMAAMGGFASKMGLASGPAVAAFLLADNNYALIINLGVIALVLGMLMMLHPSRLLDREARSS